MVSLFGETLTRAELEARIRRLDHIAGVRWLNFDQGMARGMRLLQVQSGGGLVVDLLPDRCCDIGQVWCNGLPFGWIGPNGIPAPSLSRDMDVALAGLMATCGFDHVRQPETDGGVAYPLHGSLALTPGVVHWAGPVWTGDDCVLRIDSETTRFSLAQGGMRLRRRIEVPLAGRMLRLTDEVTVLGTAAPVMALYHVNLGYPLIGPGTECILFASGGQSALPLDREGIALHPLAPEPVRVDLRRTIGGQAASLGLTFDGAALPWLQTFRRLEPGIDLFAVEPVTHDRLPRSELRSRDALPDIPVGETRRFVLDLHFNCGSTSDVFDQSTR